MKPDPKTSCVEVDTTGHVLRFFMRVSAEELKSSNGGFTAFFQLKQQKQDEAPLEKRSVTLMGSAWFNKG